MRGVAFRCMGDIRRAAESYQAAVDVCQEYEDMPNWAVALANQGILCDRYILLYDSYVSCFHWTVVR